MLNVAVTVAKADAPVENELLADVSQLMERVRRRAYELFEQRGCEHGADLEDWRQAERELLCAAKVETEQAAEQAEVDKISASYKPAQVTIHVPAKAAATSAAA